MTTRTGIPCETWGVPDKDQRPGAAVETAHPSGKLNPGDREVANRYVMAVDGHPPTPLKDGRSPWGGLSGGALFCGDLLTGVITADEEYGGHSRLVVVPTYALHQAEGFRDVLAEHTDSQTMVLAPVEFQSLTEAPSAVLPGELPSPGWLLVAGLKVVPFRGRSELLAELNDWAGTDGAGVFLLHGSGGQGKTRLAHQVVDELVDHRWAAVWLDPHRTEAELEVLSDSATPTVVVVDYAETRTPQVKAMLRMCVRHGGAVPMKVLLLARTAGEWWERLGSSSDAASMLLARAGVRLLEELEPEAKGRAVAYREAVRGFAGALPKVNGQAGYPWTVIASGLPDPAPTRLGLEGALTLHMTALADLLDSAAAPFQETATVRVAAGGAPEEVEDRLLRHEQRYWQTAAETRTPSVVFEQSTLHDVMAAVALLGADSRDTADDLLRRIEGLEDQPRDRRNSVLKWVASLYPALGDIPFGSIQPDRLAERFVGRHVRQRPGMVDRLIVGIDGTRLERLLTFYCRAASHRVFGGVLDDGLTSLCARHVSELGPVAIEVATQVESPRPLMQALELIGDDNATDLATLMLLADHLPLSSHRLAEWAARIGERLVHEHRELAEARPDAFLPHLATSLNNQSIRLANLGRREEALDAATEAVNIRRSLAEARPDAFLPNLAGSLNNQSVRLGELGRREEALDAATEAVNAYRDLAEARPDAFLPNLAGSLNNQSIQLANLGRREEALDAITEAVNIRRSLAEARPDAFLPDLAGSLNNQSNRLA
ncbi:hypothetical protein, partial [Umezawaea sp. NPDC059074]|uniref:tetratricopeptide repeat protein n=1 Tax=Umezawaea sp. NPDC059074 TaxID=3346716 RepID=UPI0036D15C66